MKKAIFLPLLIVLICSFTIGQSQDGMILIPGGKFTMGKNSTYPTDWQPEHIVYLDSFYMDKYEVTNLEFYTFCTETGHALPIFWGMNEFRCGMDFPDHPVVGVNYFDALAYAEWAGKRLPTEAEWEYAARGGLEGNNYPLGQSVDSTSVNFGKKFSGSLEIASFPPNAFGLFEICGNVWEWTTDYYQGDYYETSPAENPRGPDRGRFKVIRGGSWHSGGMCVQVYYRNGLPPNWTDFGVGFRCARSL